MLFEESSSPTRILVVEDEAIVALDLRRRLEGFGYQVVGAFAEGPEAVAAALSVRPNLVLMDISIRGPIDGIEAATQITSAAGVPIIFLTAYADSATIERAKAARPYGFLTKPFNERELRATIETAIHRYRTEEKSRLLQQAVVDASTGILVALVSEGDLRIVFCNPAFERITGYGSSEVMGRSPWILEGPDTDPDLAARVRNAVSAGREIQLTLLLHRKDGARFWSELAVSFVHDPSGRVTHALFFHLDATQRKGAEAALVQAQKVEGLGRLAGGVAHDFNNILAVITGYGEMAQRQLGPGHPAGPRLEQIQKAAHRAADLTRQLLAFGRHGTSRRIPVDLTTVISDTEKMLGRLIGRDIQIVLKKAPQLGAVKADPVQLGQIVMNLALNARDAMPSGGILTIETRNRDVDVEFSGVSSRILPGRYVALSVSDTGTGISNATLERMFEAFFTTKPEGKGTGLGLYTVQGIARHYDGHILVESRLGHGTVFEILFPRIDRSLEPAVEAKESRDAPGGTETILLAEDNEALRALLREFLEEKGYRVLQAANGEEAIALAGATNGPIDLLLTDVVMPRMGGRQLAVALQRLRPDVRVIFMSAYTDGELAPDPHGGLVLLEKPFENPHLARVVRSQLDRRS